MAEALKTYVVNRNGLEFQVQMAPSTAKELGLQEAGKTPANKAKAPANKAKAPEDTPEGTSDEDLV